MQNFRELDIWKKSLKFSKRIYILTKDFILATQLNLVSAESAIELIKELNEIQRMMNGFRLKLKT